MRVAYRMEQAQAYREFKAMGMLAYAKRQDYSRMEGLGGWVECKCSYDEVVACFGGRTDLVLDSYLLNL